MPTAKSALSKAGGWIVRQQKNRQHLLLAGSLREILTFFFSYVEERKVSFFSCMEEGFHFQFLFFGSDIAVKCEVTDKNFKDSKDVDKF